MEFSIALPWINRNRPYVAFHFAHFGWALGRGRHRQIFNVMLMWGIRFKDRGGFVSFYPEVPWPRTKEQS